MDLGDNIGFTSTIFRISPLFVGESIQGLRFLRDYFSFLNSIFNDRFANFQNTNNFSDSFGTFMK